MHSNYPTTVEHPDDVQVKDVLLSIFLIHLSRLLITELHFGQFHYRFPRRFFVAVKIAAWLLPGTPARAVQQPTAWPTNVSFALLILLPG